MKRLYVGCRVRILWSNGWPELSGRTGVILRHYSGEAVTPDKIGDWIVKPDCWPTEDAPNRSINGAWRFGPRSEQLEPIHDDGHKVISWEEMKGLWTPSHIENGAPA